MGTLGLRLKAIRKSKNITQKEMAKALGVAQSTIANYETNIRVPSLGALREISDYLEVSIDQLMSDERQKSLEVILDEKHFTQLLLDGNEVLATDYINNAFVQGASTIQMIEELFLPCLKVVGKLWETGEIDIAQEHFITALIDRMLGLVTSREIPTKNLSVALMVPGAEEHTLVLKMASEYFRNMGWQIYYIGKSIPLKSLEWLLESKKIDLIVMAVTISTHLNSAEHLIQAIKGKELTKIPKIAVGGYSIKDPQTALDFLKADYFIKEINELKDLVLKIEYDIERG